MKTLSRLILACGMIAATAGLPRAASADMIFPAILTGLEEVPPNASPAFGIGEVVLNAAETMITVDLAFANLTSAAVAAHIHGPAGLGVNGPIIFTLASIPNSTFGFVPQQSFAITPTQVEWLKEGLLYFNVHTSTFPAGEIRGQIVPEPSSLALIALGSLFGVGLAVRKRSRSRLATA